MRVICTRIPARPNGVATSGNAWVSLHSEYHVVSLLTELGHQTQLHIITDDGHSLAWFNSEDFTPADGSIPANWVVTISRTGTLEIAPAEWLAPGFWEAYYDGDSTTVDAVRAELRTILGDSSYA